MNDLNSIDLEKLLLAEIPISRALGIQNVELKGSQLSLQLPLQANLNHKGTLFGGSLYSGSALACYGLFLASLRREGISSHNIVIAEGAMKYLAPVDQDAQIMASWSGDAERLKFFQTLKAKNKARIEMKAQIFLGAQVCAEFTGQFVAKL